MLNTIVEFQPDTEDGFNSVVSIQLEDISNLPDESFDAVKNFEKDYIIEGVGTIDSSKTSQEQTTNISKTILNKSTNLLIKNTTNIARTPFEKQKSFDVPTSVIIGMGLIVAILLAPIIRSAKVGPVELTILTFLQLLLLIQVCDRSIKLYRKYLYGWIVHHYRFSP